MTKMVTGLAVWASESKETVRYTPDMAQIEQRGLQRVFFYDELQYGMPRHDLISEHLVCRNAAFTIDHYVLHKVTIDYTISAVAIRKEEGFKLPEPWLVQKRGTPALIKGELCGILSNHINELDQYYQNGTQFKRERVRIQIPYRDVIWTKQNGTETTAEQIDTMEAWMYVGVDKFWDGHIDGGYTSVPTRLYEPKRKDLENYYQFTRLEYDG